MVTFPVLQSSLDFGICVCIHSCVWRSGVSLEIISREAAHVAFGDSISPWDWTPASSRDTACLLVPSTGSKEQSTMHFTWMLGT